MLHFITVCTQPLCIINQKKIFILCLSSVFSSFFFYSEYDDDDDITKHIYLNCPQHFPAFDDLWYIFQVEFIVFYYGFMMKMYAVFLSGKSFVLSLYNTGNIVDYVDRIVQLVKLLRSIQPLTFTLISNITPYLFNEYTNALPKNRTVT